MTHIKHFLWFAFASLILVACGGGGGGDSNGGGQTSGAGAFTLSTTQVYLKALSNGSDSARQTINMTVTGKDVAYAGAAFASGQTQPQWLQVGVDGSGSNYTFYVSAIPWGLQPGNYSASFSVGTADSNGTTLKSAVVNVTLTVTPALSFYVNHYEKNMVYGDSEEPNISLDSHFTAGNDTQWTATSSANWVTVKNATGTGAGTLTTQIDLAGLKPGSYSAIVTIRDTKITNNTSQLTYNIRVDAPEITLSTNTITLGGDDGLAAPEASLTFSLNTGDMAYPYSFSIQTDNNLNWLKSDKTSGQLKVSNQIMNLSTQAPILAGGSYKATATISTKVKELAVTKTVNITYNKESNRLVASTTGIALTSAPTRSLLTRTIKVLSSIDKADTHWNASSDKPWLKVTSDGKAGDSLVISASPTGLTQGQTYIATITISSTDTDVENQETVRVGFTVLATDPGNIAVSAPATGSYFNFIFLVASPVEPLMFTHVGNDIRAYDQFTGKLKFNFANIVQGIDGMSISQDGLQLFIFDGTAKEIVVVEATTGIVEHRITTNHSWSNEYSLTPGYMRPNARPILVGDYGAMYDLKTYAQISPAIMGFSGADVPYASGSFQVGNNPNWIVDGFGKLFSIHYSALNGGRILSQQLFNPDTAQGREGQACINPQGTRIYTASGYPYNFLGSNISSQTLERTLTAVAYPVAIVCGWNGIVIGGSMASYEENDIFVYNETTGNLLGKYNSSDNTQRNLVSRGIGLSGDGSRMATATNNTYSVNRLQIITLPAVSE